MTRVKVPQADGFIQHFDGAVSSAYRVTNGEIEVDDAHVGAILASVPGAALAPEAPAKSTKPEAPAKEK